MRSCAGDMSSKHRGLRTPCLRPATLLALPLILVAAQHLEGGSQAQLFVSAGGETVEFVGGYEGTLAASDPGRTARPIPNVLGVRARPLP